MLLVVRYTHLLLNFLKQCHCRDIHEPFFTNLHYLLGGCTLVSWKYPYQMDLNQTHLYFSPKSATSSFKLYKKKLVKYTVLYIHVKITRVQLLATPWTIQSMGFSRPEYWSEQPFPFPGIFPTQGLNPGLSRCRWILYHLSHRGSPPHKINAKIE